MNQYLDDESDFNDYKSVASDRVKYYETNYKAILR